jgi:hypothetical protein
MSNDALLTVDFVAYFNVATLLVKFYATTSRVAWLRQGYGLGCGSIPQSDTASIMKKPRNSL